jgi:hypothetical protein
MKARRALGEFAVIVLGVLSALLAESFVSNVREASDADSYRARLSADLAADLQNLNEIAAYYSRVLDSGAKVNEWLETGRTDLSATDLFVHVVHASYRHPIVIRRDTWDDLVSTGKVALLTEDERISLSYFYRLAETFIVDLSGNRPSDYPLVISGNLPYEPAWVVSQECALYQSVAGELSACQADLGWDPTQGLAALRRNHPELQQDLSRTMHYTRLQVTLATVLSDLAQTAAQAIGPQGSA